MSTIKLEFPERLKQEKLFSPEQADAFARALNDELTDKLTDKLATKSDLAELESRIQTQMLQLENRMQTQLQQLESSLLQLENKVLKWMVGLFLTGTVVNVTVVGLLVGL